MRWVQARCCWPPSVVRRSRAASSSCRTRCWTSRSSAIRRYLAGTLSAVFTLFAMAGLQLVTTQRFQLVAGFSPLQAGLLVSVGRAWQPASALLVGSILHRVGLRR